MQVQATCQFHTTPGPQEAHKSDKRTEPKVHPPSIDEVDWLIYEAKCAVHALEEILNTNLTGRLADKETVEASIGRPEIEALSYLARALRRHLLDAEQEVERLVPLIKSAL